jgi:PBSX family phage terminase large subunit
LILHQNQKEIAQNTHRFRVVNCGRRFGKTVLAIEEMLGVAVAGKNRRVAYYAPTRDDAREIVWAPLLNRVAPVLTYSNDSRLEVRIKTQDGGESQIVLYGWESVQERGKGRGLSNNFIVLDEVAFYRNFWESWDKVLSPTLIDTKGSALFISTPNGFNHFYDLYNRQEKDPDFKSFHYTSYDNPTIPKEEIDRERRGKPEDVFAQEYLADFRKKQGLVYKEFDRQRHVYHEKDINRVETILGVDFGYTNPTAVLTIVRDFDSHYWVSDEWYRTGKTTEEIIEYAKTQSAQLVYPDPAEPDRVEMMSRFGLNVREVSKDITKGIDSVRELFKQNRLHIHTSCVNLLAELETYAYPDKKDQHNEEEKPIKENDHALDALRYALYNNEPINDTFEDFNMYATSYT